MAGPTLPYIEVKQIEVFATWEDGDWLVISIIVKYF